MARVLLKNVRKLFRQAVIVERLNLEVADGEFLVLVGPSGCGKSTTLNMIAGLEEVSEGEIYIGDSVVTDRPPKDRNVAMVFQNYALYPHMTVAENLGFGLKVRRTARAEIQQRVRDTAEALGLQELLSRKPRELSGGQRQRVALGRAIVRKPDVFLFDEPLSNLDAQLRVHMRLELKQLHQRLGTTAIYVTHDQTEAMTLGTQLVVMNRGVVQQIGDPLQLYRRPSNRFVAGFIGSPSMNFLSGEIESTGGSSHLGVEGFPVPIPERIASRCRTQGIHRISVGIRPEHLSIRYGSDDSRHGIPGEVAVVETLGHESYALLQVGKKRLTARIAAANLAPRVGDRVSISLPGEHLLYFDSAAPENCIE